MTSDGSLRLHTDGNPHGRTVLFIHGWPDDLAIWEHQIAYFANRYHCVRLELPNYGSVLDRARGMDFPDLARLIQDVLERLCRERGEERIFLVGHDWGAFLSYLVEQRIPQRIQRMVTVDVGGHMKIDNLKEAAMILGYQWPLIAAWLIGGVVPPLGAKLTEGVARRLDAPLDQRREPIGSAANYPYFYLWRRLVLPRYDPPLKGYRPQTPLLFIYGARKPVMFHSDKWLELLDRQPGSGSVAIDGGHWMMLSHPDEVNSAIDRFFQEA